MSGPLRGLRVVELVGIGPAPFCGMLLTDLGADVVRVDRPSGKRGLERDLGRDVFNRGKRSIIIDLKSSEGVAVALQLIAKADILIEGHRPGVMERLGLGPDVCLAKNPKLVYGRVTGWGQDGPLAQRAGHDINYSALAGVVGSMGTPDNPTVPLNVVADFGGGGMLLTVGILSAVFHAQRTGQGQVVDASMVDGAALLMNGVLALRAAGVWNDTRGDNLLDGGAPMYGVYATADKQHMTIGPLEPQFYSEFLSKLGLTPGLDPRDRANWPALRGQFAEIFVSKTRAEWESIFANSDACVMPVMSVTEAAKHPHNVARRTFVEQFGMLQANAAPKFSATPAAIRGAPPTLGADSADILAELGLSEDLLQSGVIAPLRG